MDGTHDSFWENQKPSQIQKVSEPHGHRAVHTTDLHLRMCFLRLLWGQSLSPMSYCSSFTLSLGPSKNDSLSSQKHHHLLSFPLGLFFFGKHCAVNTVRTKKEARKDWKKIISKIEQGPCLLRVID